jgi:hypothetical protein
VEVLYSNCRDLDCCLYGRYDYHFAKRFAMTTAEQDTKRKSVVRSEAEWERLDVQRAELQDKLDELSAQSSQEYEEAGKNTPHGGGGSRTNNIYVYIYIYI